MNSGRLIWFTDINFPNGIPGAMNWPLPSKYKSSLPHCFIDLICFELSHLMLIDCLMKEMGNVTVFLVWSLPK